MKKQRITLDIYFDESDSTVPAQWGFATLLDLPSEDHVVVVSAEEPEKAE